MSGYISKDFVHRGCGLELNPQKVWQFVPYPVRRGVEKSKEAGVVVKKVAGNPEDIEILRSMWYDPADPNMPDQLKDSEYMFIAYNNAGSPIGAVILLPVGNHLFLNNLAGNEDGKLLRVQDYLLWHCVNFFKDTDFDYIDVGVSYRQTLYDFFKKWGTFNYPIIFNVPKIRIDIGLEPFNSKHYNSSVHKAGINNTEEELNKVLQGRKFTFIPNIEEAEKIFNRLGIEFNENSFNFTDSNLTDPFVVDLTKIFSVQFGALIVNLEIDDKSLWNLHRASDPFKRNFIFTNMLDELLELDVLTARRKRNIELFDKYFSLDRIKGVRKKEIVPSAY
ncbi:MAG: hypothetical protein RBT61_10280, partial [Candidatus Kapabacteria bacterium]|nr:hypothetical protein [Candidatus Kapabacteria bacterium]